MSDWTKSSLTLSLVLFFVVFMGSCDRVVPTSPELKPTAALVHYTGCKEGGPAPADAAQTLSASYSAQECLSYLYDGKTLQLVHVNAAFNCCLDDIICDFSFVGNTIVIKEEGILANGQGCFCDCLYDLDVEINNLAPSVYVVSLPSFEKPVVLDLRAPTSGVHCEDRDRYPWI